METSKHHTNSKTKQRHEHRHVIQTHLTSLSEEDTTPIHHKQRPTYFHTTWLQKQPLYKHSTTQHKRHLRNRIQPKQTIRTHNHSSIRHEQSIRHKPDKTTCTLFTPSPAEYSTQLELQIDNITLPMNINPKILGLTLDPKLTYNKHIEKNTPKARKTIQILKALTVLHFTT